jgi:hydrogenase expression/formation protein HypE
MVRQYNYNVHARETELAEGLPLILPRLGKFDPNLLKEIVYPRLGAKRFEVLVGPQFGVDNAVIRIGKNKVMALTTDPISLIPSLGAQESAWLSAHNLASDLTTSGLPPAYATIDFNLPPRMDNEEFSRYWSSLEHELGLLGVMIVGGHTGRFEGCDYTIIGAGTLIGIGNESEYLTSNMSKVGDVIVLTKSASLSSAGILSRIFPHKVEAELGFRRASKAQALFRRITTVKEALTLAKLRQRRGGVSAMHDATEGGVFAAIYEMLSASGAGGIVEKDLIPVDEVVRDVCQLFSLDVYTSLSEGCLIASVRPERVAEAISTLEKVNVPCFEVGRVVEKRKGIILQTAFGKRPLVYPKSDPYWNAYWNGVREKWE